MHRTKKKIKRRIAADHSGEMHFLRISIRVHHHAAAAAHLLNISSAPFKLHLAECKIEESQREYLPFQLSAHSQPPLHLWEQPSIIR